MSGRLAGKVALITGASRGIGAAVARRFALEGAKLILVSRTIAGLEKIDDEIQALGAEALLVPLDLKDPTVLDGLANPIYEKYGRLDILIGNAAVLSPLGPLPQVSPAVWEEALAINLTANWRLLRVCDPLLRASVAGRALFVTSGVTKGLFPYWGPYAITKAALEAMVKTYAAETINTAVCANLIDPGVLRTDMRAQAMPGEDPLSLPLPESIMDFFVNAVHEDFQETGQVIMVRS